jgi:PAP2 superfamily.
MIKRVVTKKRLGQKQSDLTTGFDRFNIKNVLIVAIMTLVYIGWMITMVGLRADHVYLALACVVAFFATEDSRKVLYGFLFMILYWWVYDSLRICPNYTVNTVHIEDLYNLEKSWFGITTSEGILNPSEYFMTFDNAFLDVISGFYYLTWVPVPIVLALYLFWGKKRGLMLQFTFSFVVANILAISTYYLYPAAPPWYVAEYGFIENFDMMGNAAGLLKFDEFFGVDLFRDMYNKNGNVFAAIPSMHSAFPVLLFYYGWKSKVNIWASAFFFSTVIGIWFAAVYTSHHYIIDVICGALCAIVTIIIIECLLQMSVTNRWYQQYKSLMT